jgi:DNA polymerase V
MVQAVRYLFNKYREGQALQHVGVRVNKVRGPESFQLSFWEPAETHVAHDQLEQTIYRIRNRFGFKALVRAS